MVPVVQAEPVAAVATAAMGETAGRPAMAVTVGAVVLVAHLVERQVAAVPVVAAERTWAMAVTVVPEGLVLTRRRTPQRELVDGVAQPAMRERTATVAMVALVVLAVSASRARMPQAQAAQGLAESTGALAASAVPAVPAARPRATEVMVAPVVSGGPVEPAAVAVTAWTRWNPAVRVATVA